MFATICKYYQYAYIFRFTYDSFVFIESKSTFSEIEWNLTPEAVRHYIPHLERILYDMASRLASQGSSGCTASVLNSWASTPGKIRKIQANRLLPTVPSTGIGGRRKPKGQASQRRPERPQGAPSRDVRNDPTEAIGK